MKKVLFFLSAAIIGAVLLLSGCKGKAKQDSRELTRNDYVNKLKNQIDSWNADIDKLEKDTENLNDEMKVKAKKNLLQIRIQRDELVNQMENFKNSSEDEWDRLILETEENIAKVKNAFAAFNDELK